MRVILKPGAELTNISLLGRIVLRSTIPGVLSDHVFHNELTRLLEYCRKCDLDHME